MVFLTFYDLPGGVYSSQVIDVCRFYEDNFAIKVKLIAFISIRRYFNNRRKIKEGWRNSIVLPSFPGINNWKVNRHLLRFIMLFHSPDNVIARGVFATLLALSGPYGLLCRMVRVYER
jgi:hypothetical protein